MRFFAVHTAVSRRRILRGAGSGSLGENGFLPFFFGGTVVETDPGTSQEFGAMLPCVAVLA
jgi:hypothetical protein